MSKQSTQDNLAKMRHTAAHVLAAAAVQLKPETRLGVGPAIDDGFYQDIGVDENWTEEDLKKLQREMEKIRDRDLPITQREMSKEEARKLYKHDPYKLELIDDVEGDVVGISDMGDGWFLNLCRGGHAKSTKDIGHFKLTRLAGVYWRGDATKPQLQRIYGVLFETKKELDEHLEMLEEAKKRDHRKLGKQLDLFTFSPLVGSGLPMFTPRGTVIRQELDNYLQDIQRAQGFERVSIPHLAKRELYETSGHWDKFGDEIFKVRGKSNTEFVLKPMNCPHHTQIYASRKRSYNELPVRYSEVTMMYRDEQAGELQGLLRVRAISIDDAHVFCRPEDIEGEVQSIYEVIMEFYKVFDLKLSVSLSLRDPANPEKYLGTDEIWAEAEGKLREILDKQSLDYTEEVGEAAFYGPKIDFVAEDSLKRKWQLATIQLDFNMPERFGLKYTDKGGEEKTPVMIHRAISGSLERFMAILLEHYAGALPLWLSPTQVSVLPISDDQLDYAKQVADKLRYVNVRVEVDERGESIGKKIRDAEIMKVPVMLIVGKREVADNQVGWRDRADGDKGALDIDKAIEKIVDLREKRN